MSSVEHTIIFPGTQTDRGEEAPTYQYVPAGAVSIDAEWDNGVWISTQLFSPETGKTVVYVTDSVPDNVRWELMSEAEARGIVLHFVNRHDDTNLLNMALPTLFPEELPNHVNALTYYSPKDCEYTFGWEVWEDALLGGRVRQKNGMRGTFGSDPAVDLLDLYGLYKEGLKPLANSVGIPVEDKGLMDKYKSTMYQGLLEHPRDFLRYAIWDAQVLPVIYERFVPLLNTIMKDCLGIPERDLFKRGKIPMTIGRLVATVFEKWLLSRCGDDRERLAYKLCLCKLGYLDPDKDITWEARQRRLNLMRQIHSYKEFCSVYNHPQGRRALKRHLCRDKYMVTAQSACGVSWWSKRAVTESSVMNAVVQGGRCNNESPYEYQTGPGLDIDISGCYGHTLRSMEFPVGVPSVLSYKPNEKHTTLGKYLRRHGPQLVPGLWQIIVSGTLTFAQDLIPSTIVTAADLRGVAKRGEIQARMALLREEIRNGVITSDVLETIQKVATNAEYGEIMNLKVECAALYKADDRREKCEWVDEVLAWEEGSGLASVEFGERPDIRPTIWYSEPLNEFSGKLVEERDRLKRLGSGGDDSAQALQAVVKLIINCQYGVFASRFFEIGNTIIANHITARGRVGVWMLSKALYLRETITDGGFYRPSLVPFWRGRKPGLSTLSRMWEWHDRRKGRSFKPMGGREWAPGVCPDDANAVAEEHVRQFWAPYELELKFHLEHKDSFVRSAYWAKGDYAFLRADGTRKVRCRGKKSKLREGETIHPRIQVLNNILDGSDTYPTDLRFRKGGLLTVNEYTQMLQSRGYDWLRGLRPRDAKPPREHTAMENNQHMPLMTYDDWKKRTNRHVRRNGNPVEWFEAWRHLGIRSVSDAMAADKLPGRGVKQMDDTAGVECSE
jgi:hypothetical protein